MTKEQVIEKIKKLLRLSQSPNENEAMLAQKMAHELMTKYRLSIDVTDLKEIHVKSESWGRVDSKFWNWKKIILDVIVKVNYCTYVYVSARSYHKIELVGDPLNIQVCKDIYEYLIEAVERISENFKGKKMSYKMGLAFNLYDRIKEQAKNIEDDLDEENALIVVEKEYEKRNEEFKKKKWNKLRKDYSRNNVCDYDAFSQGKKDGDVISINKQVKNNFYKQIGSA